MRLPVIIGLLFLVLVGCRESSDKEVLFKQFRYSTAGAFLKKNEGSSRDYTPVLSVNNRHFKVRSYSVKQQRKNHFCNISYEKIMNPGLPAHDSINQFIEHEMLEGLNTMSPEELDLDLQKRARYFLDQNKSFGSEAYEFEFHMEIAQHVEGIVTVKSSFWSNFGGEHGGGGTTITNFFIYDGKIVCVNDLFQNPSELNTLGLVYFKKAIDLKPEVDLKEDNWDLDDKSFQLTDNFEPFADEVAWIINTEELGPYMKGGG